MNILNKIKQKKAFSLMETLLVVAILGILMGISMPLVTRWHSNTRMTELDNHAKTIYLEAQNRLVAMRSEGSLEKLHTDIQSNGNKLTSKPIAFSEENWTAGLNQLYYVSKSQATALEIIPEISNSNQLPGQYVIELNPETGEVFGVFYWENESQYESDILDLSERSIGKRKEIEVGYYGGEEGEGLDYSVITPEEPLEQTVELVNGEELYVKISYDVRAEWVQSQLTIKGKITDEYGKTLEFDNKDNEIPNLVITSKDEFTYYILLDSIERSFKDILGASGITPGANLTIEIKSIFDTGEYYYTDTDEVKGNSLFAEGTSQNSIKISTLRHLRNLTYYTPSGEVFIEQTGNIDYLKDSYDWSGSSFAGEGGGSKPEAIKGSFPAIANAAVLNGNGATFDGNGYKLQNFVINGNGIFGQTTNTNFVDVKVEDITVNGGNNSNVGGLAGAVANGTVENCGVYLTTYSEEGNVRNYYCKQNPNQMEARYAAKTVKGGSNVGGLFGKADNMDIKNSFAAVKVEGGTTVGGFIGSAAGTVIDNCYSSGDVTGSNKIAGFIGEASGNTVSSSYTTGNMNISGQTGGFVASTTGGSYTDCRMYGKLEKADGTDGSSSGYFTATGGSTFNNCRYLVQNGYNGYVLADNPSGVSAVSYTGMTTGIPAEGKLPIGSSYPYDGALLESAFPFQATATKSHYGDWPTEQFSDDMLLMYYEKYADGKYGFYTETEMAVTETARAAQNNVWLLDTLLEKECVEDGYALLSKYELSKFSCVLDHGSVGTQETKLDLTVRDAYEAGSESTTAIKMKQADPIIFKGQTEGETYTVSDMFWYKLPYDLQFANRPEQTVDIVTHDIIDEKSKFYDTLTVYNGFIVGNDGEGASPMIAGADAASGIKFYYCSHFAKTAINPKVDGTKPALNKPEAVSVRSARQLNALGRYEYYWSADEDFVFQQETDINFSTYANDNGTYKYCGQDFNMCANGSPVQNMPIGGLNKERAGVSTYVYCFNNKYDGQGYRIIDFGTDGEMDGKAYQYVGLFGEIEGAEIVNVVMTANSQENTLFGKVTSNYTGSVGAVGALVGHAKGDTKTNTIKNCAVAGYDVEYGINNAGQPGKTAVGGLIGISTASSISNCTAVNDLTVHVGDSVSYSGSLYVGGLAGSLNNSSLQNGYAGGKLDINLNSSGTLTGEQVSVAGVCPGNINDQNENSTFKNLYSYVEVSNNLMDILKRDANSENDADIIDHVYACVAKQSVTSDNCYYLPFEYTDETFLSDNEAGTKILYADLSDMEKPDKWKDFSDNVKSDPNDSSNPEAYSYPTNEKLSGYYMFPTVLKGSVRNADGTFVKETDGTTTKTDFNVHYGDWYVEKIYKNFPTYYEIYEYEDEEGNKKEDFGLYYLDAEGIAHSTLATGAEDYYRTITKTGYGVLKLDKSDNSGEVITEEKEYTYKINGRDYYLYKELFPERMKNLISVKVEGYKYEYYIAGKENEIYSEERTLYMNQDFAAAIADEENGGEKLGKEEKQAFQVRTQAQFEKVTADNFATDGDDDGTNDTVFMKQTYDIVLNDKYESITLKKNHTYNGGAKTKITEDVTGYRIIGADKTIFEENRGTIQDCLAENININSEKADSTVAGFITTNDGVLQNCYIENININLTGTNSTAAGFVVTNTENGSIDNCGIYGKAADEEGYYLTAADRYAAVSITAQEAYGFAVINESGADIKMLDDSEEVADDTIKKGIITQSFVTGTVTGKGTDGKDGVAGMAAGFIKENNGAVTLSYANCNVSVEKKEGTAAGFAIDNIGAAAVISKCYNAGSLKADGMVYGFAQNAGKTTYSYMISELKEPKNKKYHGFTSVSDEVKKADTSDDPNYEAYINYIGYRDTCAWGYKPKGDGKGPEAEKDKFNDDNKIEDSCENKKSLSELQEQEDYASFTDGDEPYSSVIDNDYPYPSVGVAHYGDWPGMEKLVISNVLSNPSTSKEDTYEGIFYYELYNDGSYGIFAKGRSLIKTKPAPGGPKGAAKDVLINTLRNTETDGLVVEEKGYGILYNSYYIDVMDGSYRVITEINKEKMKEEISNYVKVNGTEITLKPDEMYQNINSEYVFYILNKGADDKGEFKVKVERVKENGAAGGPAGQEKNDYKITLRDIQDNRP